MTSTVLESSTKRSGVASVSPPAYDSVSSTPTARNNSKFGKGSRGADPSSFRVCGDNIHGERERERERERGNGSDGDVGIGGDYEASSNR